MLHFNILMLKSVFGLWLKKDDSALNIWLMLLSVIESWLFVVFISVRVFLTYAEMFFKLPCSTSLIELNKLWHMQLLWHTYIRYKLKKISTEILTHLPLACSKNSARDQCLSLVPLFAKGDWFQTQNDTYWQ